jgi:hypothetical protein
MSNNEDTTNQITSPLKAIRAKCLECSNGSSNEVKMCNIVDCELYDFRFGKNPFRKKRVLSEEQKAVMVERLKNARESKQR